MLVLFKYFVIKYSYCKMPWTADLKKMKKGKFLEEKSISFIARELSRSRTAVRNYSKDAESYGTRKRPGHPPKITNAARHQLFREASKRQSPGSAKISEFTHYSKKNSSTSPGIAKSRISKQEVSPLL